MMRLAIMTMIMVIKRVVRENKEHTHDVGRGVLMTSLIGMMKRTGRILRMKGQRIMTITR